MINLWLGIATDILSLVSSTYFVVKGALLICIQSGAILEIYLSGFQMYTIPAEFWKEGSILRCKVIPAAGVWGHSPQMLMNVQYLMSWD